MGGRVPKQGKGKQVISTVPSMPQKLTPTQSEKQKLESMRLRPQRLIYKLHPKILRSKL